MTTEVSKAPDIEALYERDFYSWTRAQARALRRAAAERVNTSAPIDWAHVAEEIEDMGVWQERELWSRLRVILIHLLKWQFQPEQRSSSWRGSVMDNRSELRRLVRRNPGLQSISRSELDDAYPDARAKAALETNLPLAVFPETCPYTVEQTLDDFWPGAADDPPDPEITPT